MVGRRRNGKAVTHPNLGSWAFFLDPSQLICGILRSHRAPVGLQKRKAFSYNKRTMYRAMGPFYTLLHFLGSITYVLSTRMIIRLPVPPPISYFLSIS